MMEGIKIGGCTINTLRFADDNTFTAKKDKMKENERKDNL